MEEKTYTDSALCDAMKSFIQKDKNLIDIIDQLWAIPNPHLYYDPTKQTELLDIFLENDGRYIRMLRRAVKEVVQIRHPFKTPEEGTDFINSLKISFTDSKKVKMGEWGAKYEGVPISTECIVISTGKEQTYTKKCVAVCKGCDFFSELETDPYTHKMEKPPRCYNENCSHYKKDLQINPRTIVTGDYKLITIQEPMEESQHGAPISYTAEIKDSDVRQTYIGQRKKITAAFTSVMGGETVNDILIKVMSVNDPSGEHIEKASDPDIQQFKKWVKEPNFLQLKLARSVAPEIFNETMAKLTAILSVAGGTTVDTLTGNIHGLLIGNPSVGKSKILMFVTKMLQKSSYVNGATASGAGITIAYDDKIKGPRIGSIPQCSGGIVALDEIGKLRKEDNKYTLEAMSERTIHYDKGGFDIWTNADTTILAGANPKYDYYDFDHPIVENINLIGPLVSRFDIILNIVRENDEEVTKKRMQHIDEFRELGEVEFIRKHKLIDSKMLTKYFTYIRGLKPRMTPEASEERHDFFTRIQSIQQAKGSLPIDERFYEGLYRIATAYAKLLLSETVTKEHMLMAIDLQKEALATFKMKLSDGETVMNLQEEATTKEGAFKHAVQEAQAKEQEEMVSYDSIIEEMTARYPKYWSSDTAADDFFMKMEESKIILKSKGKYHLE